MSNVCIKVLMNRWLALKALQFRDTNLMGLLSLISLVSYIIVKVIISAVFFIIDVMGI